MRENGFAPTTANAITQYFNKANQPSQQETLGQIVVELLREGKILNRKSICTRLLYRMEQATDQEEESRYQTLIGLLFDR
ncbi:regulatory protein YcgZ [Leclercia tamurae]|uniref:Regulatory protein YcgZ n=1 Tax=Leclercia tamurae TaxID=2926467 RepID=A0ABT2RF33_9ENTR|nr:regulatory protein YcgZ [Leclercia tamurae]MCU6679470.1 regulatory protein YcgZ [Leclercia tamurae]